MQERLQRKRCPQLFAPQFARFVRPVQGVWIMFFYIVLLQDSAGRGSLAFLTWKSVFLDKWMGGSLKLSGWKLKRKA